MAIKETMIFVLLIMLPVVMEASPGGMFRKPREPLPDAPAIARTRENDAENEKCPCISAEIKVIKDLLDDLSTKAAKGCGCPSGWVTHGDLCYFVSGTSTRKWSEARQTCQRLGGDLPIIKSADENTFFLELVKNQTPVPPYVWIGLHRKADTKFHWFDDTPLEGHYNNWNNGEPNDNGGKEDCSHMYVTGSKAAKWNDVPCDWEVTPAVVCQKAI